MRIRALQALFVLGAVALIAVPRPMGEPPGRNLPEARGVGGAAGQLARCVEAVRSNRLLLRRSAARALGVLGDSAARAELLALVERIDPIREEPTLREAALALARIGDARGAPLLVALSREGRDRVAALESLGEAGGEMALARLRQAGRGEGTVIAAAAVRALAALRAPGCEETIAAALSAPERELRAAGVHGALLSPCPGAAPILRPLLRDPLPDVRVGAAAALALFDDLEGVMALGLAAETAPPPARFEAARILVRTGHAPASALEAPYRAMGAGMRRAGLGRVTSKSAAPFLEGLLTSPRVWERLAAASSLARLGNRQSVPILMAAFEAGGDLARGEALIALSHLLRRNASTQ